MTTAITITTAHKASTTAATPATTAIIDVVRRIRLVIFLPFLVGRAPGGRRARPDGPAPRSDRLFQLPKRRAARRIH